MHPIVKDEDALKTDDKQFETILKKDDDFVNNEILKMEELINKNTNDNV